MMFMFKVQGWELGLGVTGVGCFGVFGLARGGCENFLGGQTTGEAHPA